MKKVYLFVTNGSELAEALLTYDLIDRAGIEIKLVSIEDTNEVVSANNIKFSAELNIKDCSFSDGDAIILPGGVPGVYNLENNEKLIELIYDYNKKNKLIAAVCASPSILGRLGLLEGKSATCYPGFEERFVSGTYTGDQVNVDGNIITAKGLGACYEFSKEIISYLAGSHTAKEVLDQIMFK